MILLLGLEHGFPGLIEVVDRLQPGVLGGADFRLEHQLGSREIVGQQRHLFMKQRQPVVEPGVQPTGRHTLIERVFALHPAKGIAVFGAEALDAVLAENKLVHGAEHHALDRFIRSLGQRVEGFGAFDLVTEEVQPYRRAAPGREEVEDAAARGELARLGHGRDPLEAQVDQPRLHRFEADFLPRAQRQRKRADEVRVRHALHEGIDAGHHDPPRACLGLAQQPRQRRQTGGDQIGLGRHPVVGQTIPGGKPQQLSLGQAKPQQRSGPRQSLVVAGDKDHRAIGIQCDIGGEKGLGAVRHFTDQDRLTTA